MAKALSPSAAQAVVAVVARLILMNCLKVSVNLYYTDARVESYVSGAG